MAKRGEAAEGEAGFRSEWTVPRSGIDFSGFRVPTQDDAPWGTDDVVRWASVAVDVGTGHGPRVSRGEQPVAFDTRTHMLARRGPHADKPGDFWIGLRGLVTIRADNRQWGGAGKPVVTVFGRCLDGDEGRLLALVLAEAERELRASIAACQLELRAFARAAAAAPVQAPTTSAI